LSIHTAGKYKTVRIGMPFPFVHFAELDQLFLALGHKAKRGEVEDMIWEVDEDCDGCISWVEFQNLYTRGRDDKTGYEPRGLFNVVEFVMNDKEGAGFITLEEAMQIMYLRYGR